MRSVRTYLMWTLYCASSLLLCIWLAWHLLAQVNFMYPFWYSLLSIDQTIEQTAPRHLYKKQFGETSRQEHYRLFAEIVNAVQDNGKGLKQIQYRDRKGNAIDRLLTQSEIIHLTDVANFVNQLNWLSLMLFVAALILLALMYLMRMLMPTLRTLLTSVAIVCIAASIVLALVGFKKVFYWLHPIVFPADHQWFFYYEESLMSTLMKAPDLFAPLGVQLILLGLVAWGLHLILLKKAQFFKSV